MTVGSSHTDCRLLVDAPASGPWNMAVDEVLLEWAAQTGACCWRFYGWQQPTLSLGYFQAYDDRRQHPASQDCPVVRRASGGGAIVHDAEWTYSCVWPSGHRLAAGRLLLYEAVHRCLIDVLADYGIQASLWGAAGARSPHQPFLCFQRRSPGDVLVGRTKIAGSAQRRLRGAVLQHGSLLLARSPAAPELDGLAELLRSPPDSNQLLAAWSERLAVRLGLKWQRETLSDPLCQRAGATAATKYVSARWTMNRAR